MYIFLALLPNLKMTFERSKTSFITRVNFYCKIKKIYIIKSKLNVNRSNFSREFNKISIVSCHDNSYSVPEPYTFFKWPDKHLNFRF